MERREVLEVHDQQVSMYLLGFKDWLQSTKTGGICRDADLVPFRSPVLHTTDATGLEKT